MKFTQNELYIVYSGLLEREAKIEIMLNCFNENDTYLIATYKEEQLRNNELMANVRMELNYHE